VGLDNYFIMSAKLQPEAVCGESKPYKAKLTQYFELSSQISHVASRQNSHQDEFYYETTACEFCFKFYEAILCFSGLKGTQQN